MKMGVLSVQNHQFQKQFGVIGTSTVKKDWTSSLTLTQTGTNPLSINLQAAPTTISSVDTTTTVCNSLDSTKEKPEVIGYLKPQPNSTSYIAHTTSSHSHPRHMYSLNMETATAASASPKRVIKTSGSAHYTYNNNILYCKPNTTTINTTTTTAAAAAAAAAAAVGAVASFQTSYHSPLTGIPIDDLTPSPVSSNLSTPTEATEHFGIAHDDDVDAAAVNELSQRLQAELRAAKSRHLSCTEVSLPWDLTPRIAADMIKTSEREPCGVRGCAIFIDFEDETGSARRIASFKVDPNTVSTFELFLTLRQDKSGWTSLLPQFLKNLTRSSTILISPHFTLYKHKLYACE